MSDHVRFSRATATRSLVLWFRRQRGSRSERNVPETAQRRSMADGTARTQVDRPLWSSSPRVCFNEERTNPQVASVGSA